MQTHELKTLPPFFDAILEGRKTFEIRKDDRDFHVGDILHLREWTPAFEYITGRELFKRVTYITRFNQPDAQVVMSIADIPEPTAFGISAPEVQSKLVPMAKAVEKHLPNGWGFALLVFEFAPGDKLLYIANAQRESIVRAMKEWITRNVQ